ncbi:MAG: phosphotransferase [Fimbriimonadaceae bacterium]|nr:phosphotransferase [Fimbriimonadaceae bacterium]
MTDPRLEAALTRWGLQSAQLEPLVGDVGQRLYLRLRGGTLAGTAIAMLTPEAEAKKMHDWLAIGEWLRRHGVAVPAVLQAASDLQTLLITDVGDELLTQVTAEAATGCYRTVLADLARLEREAASEPPTTSPAHGRTLTPERIHFELRRLRKEVLQKVQPLSAAEMERWDHGEDTMVRALTSAPQVWMHRDLHARNLLRHDERIWWIDYQDAMIGPWLYDVASLLFDPYAALGDDVREALLAHYLQQPERTHAACPAAQIADLWATVAVQRLAHCVACYVVTWFNQQKGLYLRYLPFAVKHLRRQLGDCPAAADLAAVLEPRWEALSARCWTEPSHV